MRRYALGGRCLYRHPPGGLAERYGRSDSGGSGGGTPTLSPVTLPGTSGAIRRRDIAGPEYAPRGGPGPEPDNRRPVCGSSWALLVTRPVTSAGLPSSGQQISHQQVHLTVNSYPPRYHQNSLRSTASSAAPRLQAGTWLHKGRPDAAVRRLTPYKMKRPRYQCRRRPLKLCGPGAATRLRIGIRANPTTFPAPYRMLRYLRWTPDGHSCAASACFTSFEGATMGPCQLLAEGRAFHGGRADQPLSWPSPSTCRRPSWSATYRRMPCWDTVGQACGPYLL